MILIAQTSPITMPTPDGAPLYPTFDVSLQNPLPPQSDFISATFSFVAPPFFGLITAIIGVYITKAIIKAFQDK